MVEYYEEDWQHATMRSRWTIVSSSVTTSVATSVATVSDSIRNFWNAQGWFSS